MRCFKSFDGAEDLVQRFKSFATVFSTLFQHFLHLLVLKKLILKSC